jgi:hypothetical protein
MVWERIGVRICFRIVNGGKIHYTPDDSQTESTSDLFSLDPFPR